MACTTITTLGSTNGAAFGISSTLSSLGEYLQNVKLTAKADKQEIRGSCGTVKAVVFSKKSLDIEYTHFGVPIAGEDLGSGGSMGTPPAASALTGLATDFMGGSTLGTVYIEEVSTEQTNSEATKTTVKAIAYATS